jgi:hypothetical protein
MHSTHTIHKLAICIYVGITCHKIKALICYLYLINHLIKVTRHAYTTAMISHIRTHLTKDETVGRTFVFPIFSDSFDYSL